MPEKARKRPGPSRRSRPPLKGAQSASESVSGGWVGKPFRYSPAQRRAIADAIGAAAWRRARPAVERAAESYRVELILEREEPRAGALRRGLSELAQDASATLDALCALGEQAVEYLPPALLSDLRRTLERAEVLATRAAAEIPTRGGRPREAPRRRFVKALAVAWREGRGRLPGRRTAGFQAFVKVSLAPVPGAHAGGVPDLIRAVLAELRREGENIR